jgi:hypothetical protein
MIMTEDTAAPSSPDTAPSPSPKRWPWVAALVILGTGLGAGSWVWINRDHFLPKTVITVERQVPATEPAATNPDLDQVKAELQRLQAQANDVKPQLDISGLEDRIAHLEKNGADAATVLRLVDRIDRLEASMRDLQSRRKADAALVLAVGLLKDAVDRGASYETELRGLKALASDDDDVKKLVADLKSRAAAGIPSRAVLAMRFQGLEAVIIRADALPPTEDGGVADWKRRAIERLLTLFTVRREDGDVEGNSTAAMVARAREALLRNDWAGAVQNVASLTGEAAKVAQPWLEDSKARLMADQEIADLAAQAVAAAGAKL